MQPVQIKNLLFSMVYMISTIIEKKCHHAMCFCTKQECNCKRSLERL